MRWVGDNRRWRTVVERPNVVLRSFNGWREHREWGTRFRFIQIQREVGFGMNVHNCGCGVVTSTCGQCHQFDSIRQDVVRGVGVSLARFNVFRDSPVGKRPDKVRGPCSD